MPILVSIARAKEREEPCWGHFGAGGQILRAALDCLGRSECGQTQKSSCHSRGRQFGQPGHHQESTCLVNSQRTLSGLSAGLALMVPKWKRCHLCRLFQTKKGTILVRVRTLWCKLYGWIPVCSPSHRENSRERERVYCTWVHLKLSTWYGNKYDDIWLIYGQLGPTGEATAAYCSKTRCVCCAKAIRSKVRRRAHAGHPKSGRHGVAAAASGTVSTPIGLQVIWSGGCRGVWVIAIGTPAGTLQEQNRSILWLVRTSILISCLDSATLIFKKMFWDVLAWQTHANPAQVAFSMMRAYV